MVRVGRWRWLVVAVAMVATVLPGPVSLTLRARAQDECTLEAEPNDTPESAHIFNDPSCYRGTLPNDDRDIYILELPDTNQARLWTFSLSGVPKAVTHLQIEPVTSALSKRRSEPTELTFR